MPALPGASPWPSRRLLLHHAVQRTQAPDQLRAVDAHYFPAGELLRENGQRRAIVGVVEGRRQHQPVGDVEVGVAGGQLPAVKPQRARHGELDHLQSGTPQGVGVCRVAPGAQDHRLRVHETREVVDMPVSVVEVVT